MNATSPLWLVLNQASGSNDEAANAALVAALTQAGAPPARTCDVACDDLPTRAALDAAGVGTVAVHTGDGTLNALLTALEGWGGAVLVLPGGTTNLLSKAIHGDRPALDIVSALAAMRPTRRPCLRSACGTALIEVLAGPGAKWSDVREGMREGDLAAIADKAVEAVRESTGGAMVAIAEPALGKPEGYAGVRLVPEHDGIAVDGYGADTFGDYVRQGIALLRRDFREGPHEELGTHPALTCRSTDGTPVELMLDGERRTGGPAVQFTLAELDLDLLSGG